MHVHERLEMINQSIWHISAWVITYSKIRKVRSSCPQMLRNIRVSVFVSKYRGPVALLHTSNITHADDVTYMLLSMVKLLVLVLVPGTGEDNHFRIISYMAMM